MQHYVYERVFGRAKTELKYHSEFYTIVEASLEVNLGNGHTKLFVAEGVSRRSYKDPYNKEIGIFVAEGHARKALGWKLEGRIMDFPRKPKDVLFSA